MATIEKPKDKEVSSITLPPDTVQALRELQGSLTSQNLARLKSDVESKNLEEKMKTVFAQLDSLKGEHPELEDSIEDIKAYLILLQHNQKPEVKDATDVAFEFTRSYQSRHVRTASVGEPKTAGGINIPVPTTTFTGTDATGNVAVDYGRPIEHGDLLSSPEFLASAERGKEYLRTIAIGSTDETKGNSGITSSEDTSVKEIKETLKEINPETLDKAVTLSEKFINLVPDAQTKATLQGVHGAMILNMLRQAGHNLMIQNGKVMIEPKPGMSVVELQTKLQTLVNTGRLSIDTFKIGLLYSSPIFKKYATELGVTKDAQGNIVGIDPKANSKTFLEHVAELKKTGQNSPDITSLLASASMLESVNFPQAIKGFQDLGQLEPFYKKNPEILAAVAASANGAALTPNTPSAGGNTNNTTLSGKIVGEMNARDINGAPVSNFVSDGFKGFGKGFNDLISLGKGDPIATLAIGGALIYGIWRMFNLGEGGKFSFFKGIGMIFGLGVLNNLGGKVSGDDVENAQKKAKEVYNNMTGGTNESDKGWMDSILKDASVDLKEHFTKVIPQDSPENQKEIDRANKLLEKKGQQKRFWSYREHIAALGGPMLDCKIHNLFFSSKQGELLRSSEATLPSNLLLSDNMRKGTMKQLLRQFILGDPASPQDRKYMNDSSIDQATIDTWLKSKNLDQTKMQDMTLRQLVHHITASI